MTNPTAEELQNEGLRLFQEGLYDEASRRFSEALEHFAEEGREVEVGEMHNNIAIIRRKQSRWEDALASIEESHRIFKRAGDKSRTAQALGNMASIYASLKRSDEAIASWRTAASIFAELEDREKQGDTMMALGMFLFKSGQRQEGYSAYYAGLQITDNPTAKQKFVRMLLALQARVLG